MIRQACKSIRKPDDKFLQKAKERLDSLTKPPGSLGRLEEIAARVVAIRQDLRPKLDKKVIFTFAGDHGVTEEGVSAYPKEVTPQMVLNFLGGGAAINVLARQAGADVAVIDIGVDHDFDDAGGLIHKKVVWGTKNMTKGPAMTRQEAERSVEAGIELACEYAGKGYTLFGTGEMGIGNTTASGAIIATLSGLPAADVTGRGTGIGDGALADKAKVIERAVEINSPDKTDPTDILAKVGGAEIGGIAGLCIGGAAKRVPVLIDGFISTAGALIACEMEPKVKEYLFASHLSLENGHRVMLDRVGLKPLLNFDLRLGEGTGAALAMNVVEASVSIYNEMATFGEAGVSDRE